MKDLPQLVNVNEIFLKCSGSGFDKLFDTIGERLLALTSNWAPKSQP